MSIIKHGRQKLGQHFLSDESVKEQIVSLAGISYDSNILEIGPGKGALTNLLYGKGKTLTLIEADEKLALKLGKIMPDAEVIHAKAERVDFSSLPAPLLVISNLPYFASIPIFKHCTANRQYISRMVLMFQKEVGERLSSPPGSRHYGSLSVFANFHWEIENAFSVKPGSFTPPPKVHSVVLTFVPRAHPPVECDENSLFRLVTIAFSQKRKTLKNNLKSIYTAVSIDKALASTGIAEKGRAEDIPVTQFAQMLGQLEEKKGK